jgi:hypothetical protein
MSSLHEAAANVLLPHISGRTREANDYLWTLIGLREGGEDGSSGGRTDADIWQSFARFEKALKMYWYESGRRSFTGINAVRRQYKHGREDLDFQLLSNQRSLGLLGAYVRSLREAGLVESHSLRLSAPGKSLVSIVDFSWWGELTRQWRDRFKRATDQLTCPAGREMKVALGKKLFCPQAMCGGACAIRLLGAGPRWPAAARHLRDWPAKQAVAKVGTHLLRLLNASTEAFWTILKTPDAKILPLPTGPLRQMDWLEAIYDSPTTADRWREFLATAGRSPAAARDALVAIHDRTWQDRGHGEPWISCRNGRLWVRSDIRFKTPSRDAGWDLRWSVCHRLIHQTYWRPS